MENYKIIKPNLNDWPKIKKRIIKSMPKEPSAYVPFLHLIQSTLLADESLIAKKENKIIGIITTLNLLSKNKAYIHHFCVHETHRGCGIGSGLMRMMLRTLEEKNYKTVHLRVDNENKKAIKFYKKNGFKKKRKTFLGKKHVMEKVFL